ncbi:MAG TPA: hypothetical protein VM120_29165 [Bryobacteraceae bacterium]|nr:hypothetical protein [Bryobacteraceae bacterium]
MRSFVHFSTLVLFGAGILAAQVDRVPAGTEIVVRTNEAIDARHPTDSRIYSGIVDRDVRDARGRVVIDRGAEVELIMREASANDIVVDLESINVNGRRYIVDSPSEVISGSDDRKRGVGVNSRTGRYVGGGAIIGSIIGAIAGGGSGAAIGAATGAGAGAVGQTVTRGGRVRLPSESIITFRLDRPLRIGHADDGFTRDGRHFHRYDDRDRRNP